MALAPGTRIGHYEIESLLGEGGMGQVYLAADTQLQRRVALKVLHPSDAPEDQGIARLMREARAAAAFDHPNAISIFTVGEFESGMYLAMEFVPGKPLRSFVGRGEIPMELRVRWLTDVARALSAAHGAGLVHRDIKPENVMIRDDGLVKVLDFGIARRSAVLAEPGPTDATAQGQGAPLVTLTAQGAIVGTPAYMAPEQCRSEPVDGRTDQFAWGVMAYELLTGRLPWRGATALPLIAAVMLEQPLPFENTLGTTPDVVEALVMKALSKHPDERFAKMSDVVAALEPFCAPSSLVVGSAALSGVSEEHQKRSTTNAFANTVASSRFPGPPPVRGSRAPWIAIGVLGLALAAGGAWWGIAARAKPALTAPQASVSASASAGGVAITDLDKPVTSQLAALAAYNGSVQALRDGNLEAPREGLERAVQLDPGMAAAWLRLAMIDPWGENSEKARGYVQKARQHRASLSDHDRELLEAVELFIAGDSGSARAAEQRLRKMLDRFAHDAEALYCLALVRFDLGEYLGVVQATSQAVAADPGFALAMSLRADALAYLGRFDEANASIADCLRLSPGATDCLATRMVFDEQLGNCLRMEADARTSLRAEHSSSLAYDALAAAMIAQAKPRTAVVELLGQKWAKLPEAERIREQRLDEARLDALFGAFAKAERALRELSRLPDQDSSQAAHASATELLADILLEQDRLKEADAVAQSYLERKDAWSPPARIEDYAIAEDITPSMLMIRLRAGALTPERFAEQRNAWIELWGKRTTGPNAAYLWVNAYASLTLTREQALEAIDALPKFGKVPLYLPATGSEAGIGNAFFLGDRVDEALPHLQRAAGSCATMAHPFELTRSQLVLGLALERKGDPQRACEAYEIVLKRWGSPASRSVTARQALERKRKLECK
jgi:eukaryotic-like serine/threonine-protein kinase